MGWIKNTIHNTLEDLGTEHPDTVVIVHFQIHGFESRSLPIFVDFCSFRESVSIRYFNDPVMTHAVAVRERKDGVHVYVLSNQNMSALSPLPHHHITTSPPHHLTTSPPHHLTTSPPHHLTTSPPHHLTISPSHHLTISPSHHLVTKNIITPHHLLAAIPPACSFQNRWIQDAPGMPKVIRSIRVSFCSLVIFLYGVSSFKKKKKG